MTFIITLGIIIVLLCSASVFKLIQPKRDAAAKSPKKPKQNRPKKQRKVKKEKLQKHVEPYVAEEIVPIESTDQAQQIESPTAQLESHIDIPNIISIHLYAKESHPYNGYELLQALLSCGMRFGAQSLFHRHEKKTGIGPILFSLAACTKEGTFDLSTIGGFTTKGLVMFLKPRSVNDPVKAFELMLQTADQMISDLGGIVLNAKQQKLTKEEVIDIHGRLQRYMKNRKTMDLFD